MLTPVMCYPAAKSSVKPHLAIAGVTKKKQRPDKDKKSEKVAKWCVMIRMHQQTLVKPTTQSTYATCSANKTYLDKHAAPHSSLCGEEYTDIIRELLEEHGVHEEEQMITRSATDVCLLHDRDPSHQSAVFREFANKSRITVRQLPPGSPDLSPLDAGFFGTVKKRHADQVAREHMGWDKSCKQMEELLSKEPADPYIQELPLRWQACKESKGWHIEAKLREIKRKHKHAHQ